jgi:hypothetical protein
LVGGVFSLLMSQACVTCALVDRQLAAVFRNGEERVVVSLRGGAPSVQSEELFEKSVDSGWWLVVRFRNLLREQVRWP